MEHIVDLHTHSHYSRATSQDCTVENLYKWGKIKGITVIGTGDFTHPLWIKELQEKLEPAEPGLYKLKDKIANTIDKLLPFSVQKKEIRFVITVEIATIYSKHTVLRKLHNLVVVPSFEVAKRLNNRLEKIGNLAADGRPILGMDSKELLRMSLEEDKSSLFIPAHIWTPWFGLFGSKSGFNSIEEAYEELAPELKAVETGLSSDPYMNWRVKELQKRAVLSNSDAHSPSKLGREATVMNCELSYDQIIDGIKKNDKRLKGTIEFFPQEGKYHYDGHRVCGVTFSPQQTKEYKGICPVCRRPLTVGVLYRVDELSQPPESFVPAEHKTVEYIIPLQEIISQIKNVGVSSKKVLKEYEEIYSTLGDEFSILRNITVEDIKQAGFDDLAGAVQNMREKKIKIKPGFDGVYGVIKLDKKATLPLGF